MNMHAISAASLFRDFVVREGLCDLQRARLLADRFNNELARTEMVETDDGATYVRSKTSIHGWSGLAGRQLAFVDRHESSRSCDRQRVDPLTMTSRLDLAS